MTTRKKYSANCHAAGLKPRDTGTVNGQPIPTRLAPCTKYRVQGGDLCPGELMHKAMAWPQANGQLEAGVFETVCLSAVVGCRGEYLVELAPWRAQGARAPSKRAVDMGCFAGKTPGPICRYYRFRHVPPWAKFVGAIAFGLIAEPCTLCALGVMTAVLTVHTEYLSSLCASPGMVADDRRCSNPSAWLPAVEYCIRRLKPSLVPYLDRASGAASVDSAPAPARRAELACGPVDRCAKLTRSFKTSSVATEFAAFQRIRRRRRVSNSAADISQHSCWHRHLLQTVAVHPRNAVALVRHRHVRERWEQEAAAALSIGHPSRQTTTVRRISNPAHRTKYKYIIPSWPYSTTNVEEAPLYKNSRPPVLHGMLPVFNTPRPSVVDWFYVPFARMNAAWLAGPCRSDYWIVEGPTMTSSHR